MRLIGILGFANITRHFVIVVPTCQEMQALIGYQACGFPPTRVPAVGTVTGLTMWYRYSSGLCTIYLLLDE